MSIDGQRLDRLEAALRIIAEFARAERPKDFWPSKVIDALALADGTVLQESRQSVGKVYLVATGEVYEGRETYTRHEDAPPPMCDFEMLYPSLSHDK